MDKHNVLSVITWITGMIGLTTLKDLAAVTFAMCSAIALLIQTYIALMKYLKTDEIKKKRNEE